MQNSKIKVIELFAGVGGFRLGLQKANPELFEVVWGNQWEPARKAQDAFDCYVHNFDSGIHSNEDITKVSDETFVYLEPNLIVGGFHVKIILLHVLFLEKKDCKVKKVSYFGKSKE